jgi:hypothetical protein
VVVYVSVVGVALSALGRLRDVRVILCAPQRCGGVGSDGDVASWGRTEGHKEVALS